MNAAVRSALACCVVTVAMGVACSPLRAVTIVIGASHDASIFQNNPDHASGAGNGLFAGTNGTGAVRRALVAFDLSGIPAGAVVHSAELTLHLGQYAGMGGGAGGTTRSLIGLHRITAAWGEGETQKSVPPTDSFAQIGQGADALDGDVTWDARFYSAAAPELWNASGGDFVATASAALSVGRTIDAPYTWPSTNAVVNDVQNWVANPTTNFGWLLMHDDETILASFRGFYSRDVATAAYHPRLTVVYEPALTADFDGDRDVDGADFLAWQRGLETTTLQTWKEQFGTKQQDVHAVPEPAGATIVPWLLGLLAAGGSRRLTPQNTAAFRRRLALSVARHNARSAPPVVRARFGGERAVA